MRRDLEDEDWSTVDRLLGKSAWVMALAMLSSVPVVGTLITLALELEAVRQFDEELKGHPGSA